MPHPTAIVADVEQESAGRFELALDRVAREGRKFGLFLVLNGQSCLDLSHTMSGVRQNIGTHIFFNNGDRDAEFASDYLEDARSIMSLRTGEAFVCNPEWGAVRISFRPPFSKVWDLGQDEMRKLLGGKDGQQGPVTGQAERLLDLVRRRFLETGAGIDLTRAADELGITSKRLMQTIVDELEQAELVRTHRLRQRGNPRIIEPTQR